MGDSAKPTNIKIPGDSLAEMLNNKDQLVTIAPLIANVVKLIDDELINEIEKLFAKSASNNPPLKEALTALHTELKSFYKPPESPRQPRAGDGLGPAPIPFTGNEKPFLKEQGPDDSKMYKAMAEGGGGRKRRKSKKRNYYKKRRATKRR
jgi:hypothetical protein